MRWKSLTCLVMCLLAGACGSSGLESSGPTSSPAPTVADGAAIDGSASTVDSSGDEPTTTRAPTTAPPTTEESFEPLPVDATPEELRAAWSTTVGPTSDMSATVRRLSPQFPDLPTPDDAVLHYVLIDAPFLVNRLSTDWQHSVRVEVTTSMEPAAAKNLFYTFVADNHPDWVEWVGDESFTPRGDTFGWMPTEFSRFPGGSADLAANSMADVEVTITQVDSETVVLIDVGIANDDRARLSSFLAPFDSTLQLVPTLDGAELDFFGAYVTLSSDGDAASLRVEHNYQLVGRRATDELSALVALLDDAGLTSPAERGPLQFDETGQVKRTLEGAGDMRVQVSLCCGDEAASADTRLGWDTQISVPLAASD